MGNSCFDHKERRRVEKDGGGRKRDWVVVERWKEASEEAAAEKSRNSPGKGSLSSLYGGLGFIASSPQHVCPRVD